jgi:hypothetical protein
LETSRDRPTTSRHSHLTPSLLFGCIYELILDASLSDAGPHSLWVAHYLGDMAKAIIDGALSKRSDLNVQDQNSPCNG